MMNSPNQTHSGFRRSSALILPAVLVLGFAACHGSVPPPEGLPPGRSPGPVSTTPAVGSSTVDESDSGLLPGWGAPVFRDEFDGGLRQWTVRDHATHGSLSYDRAILSRRQVTVGNGLLAITGRRLPASDVEGERHFVTGYVDSAGSFSQRYGRWEIRAKLPLPPGTSQGVWPAFWLRPDDSSAPGEIDIMEAYGTADSAPFGMFSADKTQASLHFDQSGDNKTTGWTPVVEGLHSEFHVWAVEWTPSGIEWSIDGRPYMSVNRMDHQGYDGAFETGVPFHMRLNLQYGSEYWGFPDPANPNVTADESLFLIDYVRVWRYDEG